MIPTANQIQQSNGRENQHAGRHRISRLLRMVLFTCAAAICGFLVSCEKQADQTPPPPPVSPSVGNTTDSATPRPVFQKLAGKWARTDGDYLIQIKGVQPNGQLDAGYFNPNPIKVSRAVALQDSEGTRVVIELRDVNYPGCIYRLKYDPQSDQLFGAYYQAAVDQTFDVTFARLKE
jgi:hypothetical protein